MEEERVEVKVQAEEEEIGETHGREQGEEKGENKQSLRRMTHGWDDASQCGITLHSARASCRRRGALFHQNAGQAAGSKYRPGQHAAVQ